MESVSEALAVAIGHQQAGRLQEADEICRQILAVEPNHAATWNLFGVLHAQSGNLQIAADYLTYAIRLNANDAYFHSNLGNVLKSLRKPEEAIACYRQALALMPDFATAHYNLGTVFDEQGKHNDAISCYRRALELNGDYPEALNNLGAVLQRQWQLEEAVAHYRRALALNPDYAKAHNNLGAALRQQWKCDEAAACFQRALQLQPNFAGALCNLGTVLREQGKHTEAIDSYRRALALEPRLAEAHYDLAKVLQDVGESDEAATCYRRATELDPNNRAAQIALVHQLQHLCQWDDLKQLSRCVIEVVDQEVVGQEIPSVTSPPMSPFSFLTLPIATTGRQQLQCARQWAERGLGFSGEADRSLAVAGRSTNKPKITIGYLSADYYSHATATLVAELFEQHDRDRFAIVGYSYGVDDGSPLRRRLVKAFDRFVDVRDASVLEAAKRIAKDEVDILVDLKGYTGDARTQIVALRPAPIQVSYLGYPGTMGASFVDYILVDDFVVPPEQQPCFTEKLVHMSGCYQVNDSQREIAPRTPSRAECGLPEEAFVFCSFGGNYKITPDVFDVWMRLLEAVPVSVLWLLEGHPTAAGNLRREAVARGVAPERLVFAPRTKAAEHLARHRLADLFLDTFPVNAHTTASDALWAGCPLLTIAGGTFVSRVAGSLLRALDLSELITTNLGEYETLALQLAKDRPQLVELRARLQANRATSPLFDGQTFARTVEQAYTTMWQIHQAGEPPRAFQVSRQPG